MTIKDSPYYSDYEERIKEKAKDALAVLRSGKGEELYIQQGFLQALDYILELPDVMKAEQEEEEEKKSGDDEETNEE